MLWNIQDLAKEIKAKAFGNTQFNGVNTDSRKIKQGEMYIAIVGQTDGHDYIQKAFDNGATAVLSSKKVDYPCVVVPDTTTTMVELGRVARNKLTGPVIGVTGSVGKTTTKDMISSICQNYGIHGTKGSQNNELGVPMTLMNVPDGISTTVVELGARNVGHIKFLCDFVKPTIGLVTRVAGAHTEIFGSIDRIAQAKGELIEAIPVDGLAVLNADDPLVKEMSQKALCSVLTYGHEGEVRIKEVSNDIYPVVTLETPFGNSQFKLGVAGKHMASNAAGAAAVGLYLGIDIAEVSEALSKVEISEHRMKVTQMEGLTVVNDAYNANPTSIKAALDTIKDYKNPVAILGKMAEIADSEQEHRKVYEYAQSLGIQVISVDAPYGSKIGTNNIDDVLKLIPDDADIILVKASRSAALEKVALQLTSKE